jgi:two-component system, response regulator
MRFVKSEIPVLIVEDDQDQAQILCLLLKRISVSIQPTILPTAEKALEYLMGKSNQDSEVGPLIPHLITLDLRLPGMSGLELLQRLRTDEKFRDIPIIVLTASDASEDLSRSYKLGCTVFLRKPFDEPALKEVLQRLRFTGRF